MNIAIYVERNLMVAIAAKLIGLLAEGAGSGSRPSGLNWLIQSSSEPETTPEVGRNLHDLLPEELAYLIYDRITNRYSSVDACVTALAEGGSKQLLPGSVISVQGILSFPQLQIPQYDPFSPPNIHVPIFSVHGEDCFAGRVAGDGYALPVYLTESAKEQVCFCNNEPVEIIGIVRWSPPYRPGGSKALNKLIRAAAVLLR